MEYNVQTIDGSLPGQNNMVSEVLRFIWNLNFGLDHTGTHLHKRMYNCMIDIHLFTGLMLLSPRSHYSTVLAQFWPAWLHLF